MSEQALRRFMARRQHRASCRVPKQDAWKDEPVLGRARQRDVDVLGSLPPSDDLAEIVLDLLAGADDPPLGNAAQALARAGRGRDTEIAHLTPGELVIPKRLQTPEVIAALRRAAAGAPLAHMQVGHPRNRINPRTGAAEFDDEEDAASQKAGDAIANSITQGMGELPDTGDATDVGANPMEEITVRASRLTGPPLQSPVPGGQIRGTDPRYGSGAYGASRDGGTRTHQGVDLLADPGTSVVAPLTGTVTAVDNPYKPDVIAKNPALRDLKFVQITDANGNHAQVHYVTSSVKRGDKVVAGQTPIGTVQDLNPAYPGIPNHVHFQLLQGGNKVNPTPYLLLGQEMATAK